MLDTIIIGSGIAGLSAAIRLTAAGQEVLVLEKNAQVGGKMGEITAEGFRWDTGPSVITMRPVFEDLFRAAGRRLEDYVTLLPVEPLTRYFWPDGNWLDATRDLQRMAEQIETFEPRDVEGYLAFLAYAARLHRLTGPAFIYGDPVSPRTFLQVPVREWRHIDGWRTMQTAINSFVHSPHLRQLLGRFATYVGASPFRAPATLSVIAHVELTGGVWYPQGGIYAIARALEKLALELGVEIQLNAPVDEIIVREEHAVGVRVNGTVLAARHILSNVDAAVTYQKLLPAGAVPPSAVRTLTQAEPSVSGFILLLGVRGQHPQLAHHNIFFCQDYAREFEDIFQRGQPPTDPTVYVAITSKRDAAHAPPGCENWFVLVNAPPLSSHAQSEGRVLSLSKDTSYDWPSRAAEYRQHVLATLARHGLDLSGKIITEKMLTPVEIEALTGARRGALYGASSNNMFAAFRRPHNVSPYIQNLYLAGGTAHPGGGVPMVMLSGAAAARQILAAKPE
ncbi:MAG: phytoene desaturase [Anaerolineales bacterium]|nr:phytoene desaturase [Anaerolineales bacterium]